jgi:hypothetical protein
MPHPQGDISVRYERKGESLGADITLPDGLAGWFYWGGKKIKLHGGHQRLTL